MKKAFILGLALLLLAGLSTVACENKDGENKDGENNLNSSQTNTENGGEENVGDFSLKISVVKTTLPRGENFVVDVRFENKSDMDVKISYYDSPFSPLIPNWQFPAWWYFDPSDLWDDDGKRIPNVLTIESNGHYRETWYIGGLREGAGWEDGTRPEDADEFVLTRGTHELNFRCWYSTDLGSENPQKIEILSNTVKLTVK
jgi:hypothetical protein